MAEFIGTRISLVSNSDIRYVGTLHEINSETSTVALENVSMLGTEGRRPDNEVAALDSIYEYILFRGTDVKDLRIEEAPVVKEIKQPQVPNDPAILGSGTHPRNLMRSHNQQHNVSAHGQSQQVLLPPQTTQAISTSGPVYPQQTQYPQFYPPPSGWSRNAHVGPGGYTTTPYGGPPDWYPGQQQDFIPSSQFTPYGYPTGPVNLITQHQNITSNKPLPIGVGANKQPATSNNQSKKAIDSQVLSKAETSKSLDQTALASPAAPKESLSESIITSQAAKNKLPTVSADPVNSIPTGPKITNRIRPALPLRNSSSLKEPQKTSPVTSTAIKTRDPTESLREATQSASAAVAAAIARLPTSNINSGTRNEKAPRYTSKSNRKPSLSEGAADKTNRVTSKSHGLRDGARAATIKVEIPTGDFDFESANAKFSKKDLINEAAAGSPINGGPSESPIKLQTPVTYNKSKSFFDNISSEVKDRQESGNPRPGGREWRSEEQKKNLETFGQESIDNGERGSYRGRGRGRGGYRGRGFIRGQSSRARTGYQNRGNAQTAF